MKIIRLLSFLFFIPLMTSISTAGTATTSWGGFFSSISATGRTTSPDNSIIFYISGPQNSPTYSALTVKIKFDAASASNATQCVQMAMLAMSNPDKYDLQISAAYILKVSDEISNNARVVFLEYYPGNPNSTISCFLATNQAS